MTETNKVFDYKKHNRMVHLWTTYLNHEAALWVKPNIYKRGLKQ